MTPSAPRSRPEQAWLRSLITLLIVVFLTACSSASPPDTIPPINGAPRPLPGLDLAAVPWLSPTHFGFFRDLEIVTNWSSGQLLFREAASSAGWTESSLALRRPHSVATGANGHLYIADTFNDRIVEVDHPGATNFREVTQIAGKMLRKPHDIVSDPATGYLWVLDNRRLCRFRNFGIQESCLRLSDTGVGYARGLTVVDSVVYVAASSQGQVLALESLEDKRWTIFQSPGKKSEEPGGSWAKSGLILNDVEYFDGYWYGSSFFHEQFADGTDADIFRLIRWRNWDDFRAGRWQDLSSLVPSGLVPYFFTVDRNRLWIAAHSASLEYQGWIFLIADKG